ncbi:MAG: tRNA (N(6)-L-threonylcarbamoyladenosine(37)-C(2))-methylthiotransferase MtaB [Methylobacter sp.]|nr:MAG: tRNA (N(6)-L-threonylcarbamoyladenosine(37)-C(2))-methylthiotransferase MtaB [Methylobacter sp.]
MNIHLKTLGCRLNEAELETWAQGFQKAGHQITRDAGRAQVIVLNSCAVTQDAARKSRNLIRRIHRENPAAKLVVSGCYATLNPEEASALLGVDLVIGNQDKNSLVETTLTALDIATMPEMSTEPGEVSLFSRGRQRAFIKVQDGCRYRCTFCIVTVARGDERSREITAVIDEINTLNGQGVDEVILTGVHLGGYGSDLNLGLTDLIKAVLAETGVARLRLGSLEPWELNDEFFALFENPRLMPHLHLPLQSGSDSVLKRMGRRCKTEEFSDLVDTLRQQNPYFNVTTDIIAGFPGETEEEWRESMQFIERMQFGHIHIFTYSNRAGTKAAGLPGQIPAAVKKQRSQELHALAEIMKLAFWELNLGRELPVLWEGYSEPAEHGKKRVFGYTPNYLRVGCLIKNDDSIENQTIQAKLMSNEKDYVLTELLPKAQSTQSLREKGRVILPAISSSD